MTKEAVQGVEEKLVLEQAKSKALYRALEIVDMRCREEDPLTAYMSESEAAEFRAAIELYEAGLPVGHLGLLERN